MKLHRPLVAGVVGILHKIFEEHQYADKVIETSFKKNTQWGARDRKFIAETVYEMVRWWRLISKTAEMTVPSKSKDLYFLFAVWQLLKGNELPLWPEFEQIDPGQIKIHASELKKERRFRESFPDWMDELLQQELGNDVWETEAAASNKEADVVIRVNTLKTDNSKAITLLQQSDITLEKVEWPGLKNAFRLAQRKNIQTLDAYKKGMFEIQDASSQLIAPFLSPQPGQFVVDACAGAGGKSLHLAALMQNKGKIISMDVEEYKLKELERRAERAGAKIIQTQLISSSAIEQLKNSADLLLMDVPCSGLGTIRRNPDAKWKLSKEFIDTIKQTQHHILSDYSKMLKPGGRMVYATCSILPSENQDQIERFLKSNSEFELLEDKKILPSQGFDGFYMALLKRKN